jgi:hypothetical protein
MEKNEADALVLLALEASWARANGDKVTERVALSALSSLAAELLDNPDDWA